MKSETPENARTVRSELVQWDLTTEAWREPFRVMVEDYRPDGQLASSESRFGEGPVCRCSNSYDEPDCSSSLSGRAAMERRAGSSTLTTTMGGSCARWGAPDGAERVTEEHAYGPGGEHTRIFHIPPMEGVTGFHCAVEGTDHCFNAPGATTISTAFDSQGRASEVLVKDTAGTVLRRVVLTRDGSGRLVKDEVLLGEPIIPDLSLFGAGAALFTCEYMYDERGRCVELVRRMLGLSEQRDTYCYDDHGNKTETTTEYQSREANINEGKIEYGAARLDRRQQARIACKYDARGNWTERLTSQRHGENPDFTPCSIERREIAYYDNPA